MRSGQKHLVKCRCILSQFKGRPDPPFHRFIVFSKIDEEGHVVPKYVQCNNCGIVHKVVDVCKSEVISSKESMSSVVTVDDIRPCVHPNLAGILEKNMADLPTWEACQHAVDNQLWGETVILTTDIEQDTRTGKYVRILGETLFRVDSYTTQEVVGG